MEDNKPVEPIVPQDQQTPDDPGYSYKDIKEDTIREIVSNTELPEAPKPPVEEPKAPVVTEPEIPLDEIGKKIAEDTANAIYEKQRAEAQARLAEEEKAKAPSPNEEYQKIVKEFEIKEGRAPTWDELAVKIEERTIEKIQAKQAEDIKQWQAQQEQAKIKQEEENKYINTIVDDELSDLYNSGRLTKIVDPKNPTDQGVLERKALFTKWAEVNNERRAKGLPDIVSATRIHEFYYTKPSAQPAGVDAPVAGNKGQVNPPSSEKEYTYKDIHNKPWSWFKKS